MSPILHISLNQSEYPDDYQSHSDDIPDQSDNHPNSIAYYYSNCAKTLPNYLCHFLSPYKDSNALL